MVLGRRRFALALLRTTVGAGCLDGSVGSRDDAPGNDSGETTTGNVSWWTEADRTVDRDKAVELNNRDEAAYTVGIRVLRESSGEVVHEGTYELAPGTRRREVFNTESLDGPGDVGYEVRATMDEQSASVSFETDQCHGGGYVEVRDGDLLAYSGIC